MIANPANAAETIEMRLGLCTQVGSGKHVLDGSPDITCEGAILRAERGGPL